MSILFETISKNKLFISSFLTCSTFIAWETNLKKRHLQADAIRSNFFETTPDLPFYGRRSGASFDYELDLSLKNYDLVFIEKEIMEYHFPVALYFYIVKKLKNTVADQVGIIVNRHGINYVLRIDQTGDIRRISQNMEERTNGIPKSLTDVDASLSRREDLRFDEIMSKIANFNIDSIPDEALTRYSDVVTDSTNKAIYIRRLNNYPSSKRCGYYEALFFVREVYRPFWVHVLIDLIFNRDED